MILVVGATGQLGSSVVRKLTAAKMEVRAFVRQSSQYQHLESQNVQIVFGDLRDEETVDAACQGIHAVIATANTIVPKGQYSFEAIEGKGYQNLISACKRHGVHQFIFMSVPPTPYDSKIPECRYKRLNEQRLIESGIPHTIFHGSLFMDSWLSLIGSSIPLRGAEAATLKRPFWFSKFFMSGVGHLIENRGVSVIPGKGNVRHAFVAVDDVATILVKSIDHPQAQNATFDLGGPENLTLNEVVSIFEKVLSKNVRTIHIPSGLYRFQQLLLKPISPAAANIMGLNWLLSRVDTSIETKPVASVFDVSLKSVEEFLSQKLNLPE